MGRLVRREELPVAGTLALLYFLVILAFTLGKIARDGLFLAELPAARLPYVYIALALLSALFVHLLGRRGDRGQAHRRLATGLLSVAASLVLFSLWFRVAGAAAAIPFYLWSGIYGLTLVSQFWLLVTQRLDPRQAKRLFGLIGAAGIAGGLLAGAMVSLAGARIEPRLLLIVAAALFAAAAAVAARAPRPAAAADTPERAQAHEPAPRKFFGEPYVRLLAALFLVAGIGSGLVDYGYKLVLQEHYREQITSLLGVFYAVQNVGALAAQLGIAGVLFARFGNRVGSTALAAGVAAGAAVAVSLPAALGAGAVLVTRLYDATLRSSLARSSWEFLFFPVAEDVKQRAKRFIDVVVNRAADAGAGLLVLGVGWLFGGGVLPIAALVVVVAALWLSLELTASRTYARELERSLARRIGVDEADRPRLGELAQVNEIVRLLDEPEPARAIWAVEMLESLDPAALRANADLLRSHPRAEVRARGLAALAAAGAELERPAGPPLPLFAVGTDESVVAPGRPDSAAERVAWTARVVASEPIAERRRHLLEAMDDSAPEVRRVAYRVAGVSRDPELVPALLERLRRSSERARIREAMVLFGPGIAEALGDALAARRLPRPVRSELVTTLERIGAEPAARALLRALEGPADTVASRALAALDRLRRATPALPLPTAALERWLGEEIDRYCRRAQEHAVLEEAIQPLLRSLLRRVVGERGDASLERIFRLLALIYDPRRARLAYRGLVEGRAELRAQALEVLDASLPAPLRRKLVPVLEASSGHERARAAARVVGSPPPTLEELLDRFLETDDAWLRACALFVVGSRGLARWRRHAARLRDAEDRLVSDTARWAMRRIDDGEEVA